MGKRRTKGTGSITETSDGTYKARITLPDPKTGEPTDYRKNHQTWAAADEWLLGLLSHHMGGSSVSIADVQNKTLISFLRDWINAKYAQHETNGKPSITTIEDYETMLKQWVLPQLGHMKIASIHEDNIAHWLKWLNQQKSPATGRKLSHDRRHRIWGTLNQAFKHAVVRGYAPRNPMDVVEGVKQTQHDVRQRAMSKTDYEKLMTFLKRKGCSHKEDVCSLRTILAVVISRRQGEILGLQWNNVFLDVAEPYMQITHHLSSSKWRHGCGDAVLQDDLSYKYSCSKDEGRYCPDREDGGLFLVEGTKSSTLNKPVIPIGRFKNLFIAHREAQDADRLKAEDNGTIDPDAEGFYISRNLVNLVFTQPRTMRPYGARMDYDQFVALLKKAGIKNKYRFHDTRHTAITEIVRKTGNLQVAQQIAGHANIATTAKYSHPDLAQRSAALDVVMDGLDELTD